MKYEGINDGHGRVRIVHFVTGGGSGATRVAADLALAEQANAYFKPLLLLREKHNPLPEKIGRQLREGGVEFRFIEDRWPKKITMSQIERACREFKPRIFVAHGNSEHLWGRRAAIAAGVPHIVHVEHNLEKYKFWRRWQARRLAGRTDLTVCVSGAVAQHARRLGIASANTQVVYNGSDISRYAAGDIAPLERRPDDIVMAARFAGQKDHATLVRAAKLLADGGWRGTLILAGGGKASHRRACEKLVTRLGLEAQVRFAGFVDDMPVLLRSCRVSVLSTFYEGFGLSLTEGMAANCAVVGSDVPGVREVIRDGETGFLFPVRDEAALAGILKKALAAGRDIQQIADNGHVEALSHFTVRRMADEYDLLFRRLGLGAPLAVGGLHLQHL